MEKIWTVDFIQIPHELIKDKNLRDSDKILYGVVLFFSKMNKNKCIASNESLKNLCNVGTTRTVQFGLERLEKNGYIERSYRGNINDRYHRKEIKCLMDTGKPKISKIVGSLEEGLHDQWSYDDLNIIGII